MIVVMIGLGGATRLTGSGLSIMEWAPFRGALPPWSEAEWQRLFGGDPAAVGRSIDSDNGMVEVVGVMPPEFAFPWSGIGAWQPYAAANVDRSRPAFWQARFIEGVGRLAPGLSPTQVEERLAAAETRAREAHGLRDNGWRMTARPVLEEMVAGVRPVLWGAFAIALISSDDAPTPKVAPISSMMPCSALFSARKPTVSASSCGVAPVLLGIFSKAVR